MLDIINLSYESFNSFNFKFQKNKSYSIIGDIKCGNDTLFRILSTTYMTNNNVILNDITLNEKNRYKYLLNIGVIKEVNNNSFIFDDVYEELSFSLKKLDISEKEINRRINFYLKYFDLKIKTKKISELDIYEKQLLIVIMALLHEPSVIIMEDIYSLLKLDQVIKINKILEYFIDKKRLTVIKFFNNFDFVNQNDSVLLMDNYEIIKNDTLENILSDDKDLNDRNLRIPFMYDLSYKLKMYKLVDKVYLNMEDMVNDIWK